MGKGNFLMGTVRGKVGDMVFSRQGGEQRSRAYIPVIGNPRTRSQMAQRVQLANLVAFYRNVIRLFPSAFQNKPANQSDYNQFVSKNLGGVKLYLTKAEAAAGACVAAPYQLTQGSIRPIQIIGSGVSSRTDIYLGAGASIDANTTVAELTAMILANNSNFAEGEQLSYVSVIQGTNGVTGYPMVTASLYSFTLSLTDATPARDLIPEYGLAVVSDYLGHGASAGNGGFAWVRSSIDGNGKIKVSSQSLILTSDTLYREYASNTKRNQAMISYGVNPDVFLNPRSNNAASNTDADPSLLPASVASVSIGGVAVPASFDGTKSWDQNDAVVIVGTNFEDKEFKLLFSTSEGQIADYTVGAVDIDTVLSDVEITATQVTGKLTAAKTLIRHFAVIVDDTTKFHADSGDVSLG